MPDPATVLNLKDVLAKRLIPAVTRWNRLEGRPRTHHFDRALAAEVRDALWMLTRQWQMGEFRGDDAGSPVLARICTSVTSFDRFQPGTAAVEPFTLDRAIETTVERRSIPWNAGAQKLSFDLRAAIGRRWLKLIGRAFDAGELSADYSDAYRTTYRIEPPDPTLETDAAVCAHPEAWQQLSALAGRAMDGFALLDHLADPTHHVFDGIGAAPGDEAKLTQLAASLQEWLAQLVSQPRATGNDAWLPRKLEYQFGCSAPLDAGTTFVARADEYYHGHLDWYALERTSDVSLGDTPSSASPPTLQVNTFIPVSLVFAGMPNTRWWAFEDRRTNFGEVKPDTTDLGKLLLLEFALVYANDWFVLPYTLPIGSVSTVKGIAVTNVFDERIWVEAVRDQTDATAQRWSMFQLTRPAGAEPSLVLLPAIAHVHQGAPLEEIALIRDEMANMVWGIERRIPLATGAGKPGAEAGIQHFTILERIIGSAPEPTEPKAPIKYDVMNTVPEHWIPFVPAHVDGSSREIQLQRAAMPRLLGDPANFALVRPRTTLLRQGLDEPTKSRYYVDEEEVPRAGALVRQAYQRTRWLGGKVLVWFGVTKTTGRGEGYSGLKFDRLVETQPK